MATYVKLRATAQRLIQKNGRTITYRQKGGTLVDVTKPWLGTTGDTTLTPKAAFIDYEQSDVRGQLVQAGDKQVLIAADDLPGITPGNQDSIEDGSIRWGIVSVNAIDPSDAPIVYEFHVRA